MSDRLSEIALTDAQGELLDYWRCRQRACGCAPRAAINPGELRGLLANISVVELSHDGSARFRLAGSKLRDIVGGEARGRSVSDMQGGDLEPWCDALLTLLDTRAPVSGVTERAEQLHIWLRLPLLDRAGNLTQIMCHDELINSDGAPLRRETGPPLIQQRPARYAA